MNLTEYLGVTRDELTSRPGGVAMFLAALGYIVDQCVLSLCILYSMDRIPPWLLL